MENNFKLPRWDDIPDVDLYLEQVISLIDKWLKPILEDGEKKVVTKTMINNYVKLKIINPPVNKKYDKLAVASLIVVVILKPVCSILEIGKLIDLALKANDRDVSYNQFCEVIEEAVKTVFGGKGISPRGDLNEPQYILRNIGTAFACQLYVKKTYLLKD
ncbi:MAG: DUF1836 domain-containing protein [Anaerovoracaceae bacterium]